MGVGGAVSGGTCFGFEVRSPLPFNYLRGGAGEPLAIREPSNVAEVTRDDLVIEWTPTPELPFHARLYSHEALFRLWIDGAGWFEVDPEARAISLPETDNPVRREERLWGIPAILCFLWRGDLPLHAASVEVDGGAILLCAPRTFGKTTLAAAFVHQGFRLLSEDVSCVRLNATPSVIPGPAMLRLRRDIAERLDIPRAHRVGEPDDRMHLALDPAQRGNCDPIPIRAVVFLRDGDDEVALEGARASDAIRDLWSLSFRLPSDADRARCFAGVTDLVNAAPVWNLSYPRRIHALRAAVERIITDA
ncbi:MAG: hypothetical protein WD027_00345 [Gaiellales bacterium]